ncbi:hypothetical protein FRC00_007665 [Tulasnella sp. 408]|nr:hypothetical protein FRC00_007665 [Tulasnella sp. 408]
MQTYFTERNSATFKAARIQRSSPAAPGAATTAEHTCFTASEPTVTVSSTSLGTPPQHSNKLAQQNNEDMSREDSDSGASIRMRERPFGSLARPLRRPTSISHSGASAPALASLLSTQRKDQAARDAAKARSSMDAASSDVGSRSEAEGNMLAPRRKPKRQNSFSKMVGNLGNAVRRRKSSNGSVEAPAAVVPAPASEELSLLLPPAVLRRKSSDCSVEAAAAATAALAPAPAAEELSLLLPPAQTSTPTSNAAKARSSMGAASSDVGSRSEAEGNMLAPRRKPKRQNSFSKMVGNLGNVVRRRKSSNGSVEAPAAVVPAPASEELSLLLPPAVLRRKSSDGSVEAAAAATAALAPAPAAEELSLLLPPAQTSTPTSNAAKARSSMGAASSDVGSRSEAEGNPLAPRRKPKRQNSFSKMVGSLDNAVRRRKSSTSSVQAAAKPQIAFVTDDGSLVDNSASSVVERTGQAGSSVVASLKDKGKSRVAVEDEQASIMATMGDPIDPPERVPPTPFTAAFITQETAQSEFTPPITPDSDKFPEVPRGKRVGGSKLDGLGLDEKSLPGSYSESAPDGGGAAKGGLSGFLPSRETIYMAVQYAVVYPTTEALALGNW